MSFTLPKFAISAIGTALLTCAAPLSAHAFGLVNFDDLPTTPPEDGLPIPNNYAGFDWGTTGYYVSTNTTQFVPSGYSVAAVSGSNVAFNGFDSPITIRRSNGDRFNFLGAALTAVWRNNLDITIESFVNGVLQNTQTVQTNTNAPLLATFSTFNNIDTIRLSSSGGSSAGFAQSGFQFAIDDFNTSAVPEPFTIVGSGIALGVGAMMRRKQLKKKEKSID
ncbi:hypothetical protein LEP3755_44090 [Leptolyngbya sp. NIES-3755]|nr:hypothetical protein LEP3755_44090 [Leptolyngbya sp. NIES-3755]